MNTKITVTSPFVGEAKKSASPDLFSSHKKKITRVLTISSFLGFPVSPAQSTTEVEYLWMSKPARKCLAIGICPTYHEKEIVDNVKKCG